MRYYDAKAILYATSHFLSEKNAQIFSVIKFDGITKNIQYEYTYDKLYEPLTDMKLFLARERLVFTDPSEQHKKIVIIDHNSKKQETTVDTVRMNPMMTGFGFCFFQEGGHIAIFSKPSESTAGVDITKHVTTHQLPTEPAKCFL